jgi:hypothetical protein
MKELPLTRSKVALLDDEDFERASRHKWYAMVVRQRKREFWYAASTIDRKVVLLHRFLLDAPNSHVVDHRNNDGLDCQRTNMRLATRSQNNANREGYGGDQSPFKGVYLASKKWKALICANGDHIKLGLYETAEEAAAAYDEAARALFGEFACVNFPLPDERQA